MLRYLFGRFRLHTQGLACALIFWCCFGIFRRLAAGGEPGSMALTGAITFVLFFLLLRLGDDLDDLGSDTSRPATPQTRRHLLSSVGLVVGCIVALNLSDRGLLAASAGSSVAVFVPAVAKRWRLRAPLLLAILYEGVPATFLAYSYIAWRVSTGYEVPHVPLVAALLMFWCAYEFWKLTRKLGAGGTMQPYYLGPSGLRRAALSVLTIALIANATVASYADWSLLFSCFLVTLPVLFAIAVSAGWPADWNGNEPWAGPKAQLAWRGLVYPAVLSAGTLTELMR